MASPCSDPDPLLPRTRSGGHHRSPPAPTPGGWTSARFIIGVEVSERFAFYGVSANLISYLTGPLGESTAAAAAAINTWAGAASMLPLLGAALADAWLGRYRTIVASSVLYISGLAMVAISSVLPSMESHHRSITAGRKSPSPSSLQSALFYGSLYLVAIAQGGHKPCVQAFGADQFDPEDPDEAVSRSSFFNWWFFGISSGATVTVALMSYLQDNVGWGVGFGVPCIVMLLALLIFLLGTRTYRFYVSDEASLFARLGEAFRTWQRGEKECQLVDSDRCAANASLAEEAKGLARLFPIWATCLLYGVVFAQSATLFTKQAATLDRSIGASFQVPAAALQCFMGISIIMFVAAYDRVLVPLARKLSGIPSGITMLQRIGVGMVLSLVTMAAAALVETKRLRAAREAGMVDRPGTAIPMSLWWMAPQYVLLGAADAFAVVGMQEFFYDQVPGALRSVGLELYLSVLGVGSFLSGFLIAVIDGVTKKGGRRSWFSDDLNRAHLDYFYLLLAALSALELLAYVYFAMSYVYRTKVATASSTHSQVSGFQPCANDAFAP